MCTINSNFSEEGGGHCDGHGVQTMPILPYSLLLKKLHYLLKKFTLHNKKNYIIEVF